MENPLTQKERSSLHYTMPKVRLPLLAAMLWNSGNSLIGLAGGLGGKAAWDSTDFMLEVSGGWLIGLLSCAGWAGAITLGDVVLYAGRDLIPILHAHERVHVHQGRLWGPFFLPAYGLESAWQWLRTGDGYRSNRFEVAAYGVEESRD